MKALFLFLTACGAGAGTTPDAPGTLDAPPAGIELVLGTSATDGSGFLPLIGDQTLVAGAQGGFHVWLKVRVLRVPPGDLVLHRTASRVDDGRLILDTQGVLSVGPAGDAGSWEQPSALPSFMCPTPIGVAVRDQAVRLDVTLLDAGGATLAATSAEFTPRCPAGDELQHCLDICSG